jgi:hypothetical protein
MARRVLNRRQLRQEADQAAPAPAVAAPKKARVRKPAVPRVRKPPRKKEPVRLRARWCVYDGGMKQVALFDYSQRAAADQKLADLKAGKKGVFFLQIVKEPMPAPAAPPA